MLAAKKNAWLPWVYALAFIAACVWIFHKCRFGFADADESFYLTVPLRLVRGDGLFVHEWHLSQMASFLTMPIMFLYMKLVGTTAGIALAFRYIFTVVWIAGSLFVFGRLRRVSAAAAMASSLSIVLFAPFGIMALSYNSLGVLNVMLSTVLLCTAKGRFAYAAAGIFFAAAVLCCPYLAAVYALYSAALLLYGLRHREALTAHGKDWLSFTLGVCVLAVLFISFVLSRASVHEIADALPHMLSDPEHQPRTVWELVKGYIGAIAARNIYFKVFVPMAAALLTAAFVLRKREKALRVLFILTLCCTLVWLVLIWTTARRSNYLTYPLQLAAVFAALTVRDRRMRRWVVFGYLPSVLYSVCIHLTSNMASFAISSALASGLPAVFVLLFCLTEQFGSRENAHPERRVIALLTTIVLLTQIGMESVIRHTFTFWEDGIEILTSTVDSGPDKGLRTTPEKKARYEQLFAGTKPIRENGSIRNVLYLSSKTYLYLMDSSAGMATFSAWQSGVTRSTLDRLEAYYALHPDKAPQAVFYDVDSLSEKTDALSAPQVAEWVKTQFGMTAYPAEDGDIWFMK